MANQRTIAKAFSLEGKGLHTGLDIKATFKPAPENFGIRIKRVDLDDEPEIKALAENVNGTTRGTVISKGGVTVSTIEHAMAALFAHEIDNCLLEVNAPELPILDGSAKLYSEELEKIGYTEQSSEREVFYVRHRMEYKDEESGSTIVMLPDNRFSVDVHVGYDSPILSNQYASLEDIQEFPKEIAACRTFVFVREIEQLVKANLIKGGDLDNAIVIYDKPMAQNELDHIAELTHNKSIDATQLGYLNGTLRFSNEPARHKLLDLMGDLSLIGMPIMGKVIATHPGHKTNTAFAKKIRQSIRRQEIIAPVYDPDAAPILDNNGIKKLLPHRWPFLLIDKIIELDSNKVIGIKNVTADETFFTGHFPQEPVMPGVLIVEAMAQTGGILALHDLEEPERYSTYFAKMNDVKFKQKVVPGDTLIFRLELIEPIRRGFVHMRAAAFVGQNIVTEADLIAQIIKNK